MDINLKPEEKEFIVDSIDHGLKMVDTENNEPFFPFVQLVSENAQRSTHVLADIDAGAIPDINKSLEQASNVISDQSEDATFYGLVWDGFVTIDGDKQDCILIEFGSKDNQESSFIFVQPYTIDSDNTVNKKGGIRFAQNAENRLLGEPKFGSMLLREWKLCVSSPFIVFKMVAGADGTIDDKEFKAFVSMLTDTNGVESQGLKIAFEHGIESHAKQLELLHSDFDPVEELTKVRQIISAHTEDEGRAFCEGLYKLGESVAKSSGGFLGFKSIGKEEKAALGDIKRALSL